MVLVDWFEGRLKDDLVSQDNRKVYLPIEKDGNKLSLVTARKIGVPFDLGKLMLVKAISSHFSVAFENARLYSLAITDELTGLYTKRHFVNQIEKAFLTIRRAERSLPC